MDRIGSVMAIIAASAAASSPVWAHHSRSVYDLESRLTLEGVVVEYEWSNPHVYIYVEAPTEGGETAVWEIEASPPVLMQRRGWTRDTLAVGDEISVIANPARDPDRAMALGEMVRTADGAELDMLSISGFLDPGSVPSVGAEGISGIWLTLGDPAVLAPFVFGPTQWPLTARGAEELGSFDETMNPGRDCIAYTAPMHMAMPDAKSIEIGEDVVTIRSEWEGVERTVLLNVPDHAGASESRHGHSIGWWEDDVLVVDTTLFDDHRMGNAFGLPSGPGKHLVERFALNADGVSLTYSFALEDPEYIGAPIESAVQWAYRPDLEIESQACDLENARRYLPE